MADACSVEEEVQGAKSEDSKDIRNSQGFKRDDVPFVPALNLNETVALEAPLVSSSASLASAASASKNLVTSNGSIPTSPRLHLGVTFPYGNDELCVETLLYSVKGAIKKAQEQYELQLHPLGAKTNLKRRGTIDSTAPFTKSFSAVLTTTKDPLPRQVDTGPSGYFDSPKTSPGNTGKKTRRIILVCIENQVAGGSTTPLPLDTACFSVIWAVDNVLRPKDIVVLVSLWEQERFFAKIIDFAREHGPRTPRSSLDATTPRTGPASPVVTVKTSTPRRKSTDNTFSAAKMGRWINGSCKLAEAAHRTYIEKCPLENVDVFPLVLPVKKSMLNSGKPYSDILNKAAKILQCDMIVVGPPQLAGNPKGRKLPVGAAIRDITESATCTVVQAR